MNQITISGDVGPLHYGVCSNYLKNVSEIEPIYVFFRRYVLEFLFTEYLQGLTSCHVKQQGYTTLRPCNSLDGMAEYSILTIFNDGFSCISTLRIIIFGSQIDLFVLFKLFRPCELRLNLISQTAWNPDLYLEFGYLCIKNEKATLISRFRSD